MGSLHLQQLDAHWDHEPKAPASWTHSKRFANLRDVETARQRLECVELAPAFCPTFMDRMVREGTARSCAMVKPKR